MAKTSSPNTGGSQFFITEVSSPHLDGIHTVFGKVVTGSELITAIQSVETNNMGKPLKDVTLTEIKIVVAFMSDGEEPIVTDPGKDDSIVEGGTCNAGQTKPPDNADCRYCVCLGDNTWKCDSGACKEEEQTATESAKSGGLSTSSLAIGGVAILLFILTIALTASNSSKDKDNPWDNPPEDVVLEQVPEMPPLEGGPPKA